MNHRNLKIQIFLILNKYKIKNTCASKEKII